MAAPPPGFDPATLGPRQLCGWVVPFSQHHEQQSPGGMRYVETFLVDAFERDRQDSYRVWFDHELLPVGHTLEVTSHPYGLWGIAELDHGPVADMLLEAARFGAVGYSVHAIDLEPDLDTVSNAHGMLTATRRRMVIKEISLTTSPAYEGAVSTNPDAAAELIAASRDAYYRQLEANKRERDQKMAAIMLKDSSDCLHRAHEIAKQRGNEVDTELMRTESDLIVWAATMRMEAEQLLADLGVDPVDCADSAPSDPTTPWEGAYGGQIARSYDIGRQPL